MVNFWYELKARDVGRIVINFILRKPTSVRITHVSIDDGPERKIYNVYIRENKNDGWVKV